MKIYLLLGLVMIASPANADDYFKPKPPVATLNAGSLRSTGWLVYDTTLYSVESAASPAARGPARTAEIIFSPLPANKNPSIQMYMYNPNSKIAFTCKTRTIAKFHVNVSANTTIIDKDYDLVKDLDGRLVLQFLVPNQGRNVDLSIKIEISGRNKDWVLNSCDISRG